MPDTTAQIAPTLQQFSLLGKTALITGSARGIGRAMALAFARAGADVVVNSRSEAGSQRVAEEIRALGRRALAYEADVSDAAAVDGMIGEVLKEWQTLDILVNNAGITRDGLLLRMKDEQWHEVLRGNLNSAFHCTRAVSRAMMKQRHGRIINVSSVVGIMGNAGQANYAASKAGLIGFTKAMAKELASRGVTVNAIAPGFIKTDMTDALGPEAKETLTGQIPMARLGEPEDVADAALFLASDAARYITGQVIVVDGGMTM